MKIINPGKPQPRKYQGTCTVCGCVFEIDDNDLWRKGIDPDRVKPVMMEDRRTFSHHCPMPRCEGQATCVEK